jgi:hypothetical protein
MTVYLELIDPIRVERRKFLAVRESFSLPIATYMHALNSSPLAPQLFPTSAKFFQSAFLVILYHAFNEAPHSLCLAAGDEGATEQRRA